MSLEEKKFQQKCCACGSTGLYVYSHDKVHEAVQKIYADPYGFTCPACCIMGEWCILKEGKCPECSCEKVNKLFADFQIKRELGPSFIKPRPEDTEVKK